jgi:hypothetical protein
VLVSVATIFLPMRPDHASLATADHFDRLRKFLSHPVNEVKNAFRFEPKHFLCL